MRPPAADLLVQAELLGPNSQVILWVIAGLLGVIATFIGLFYRGIMKQLGAFQKEMAGLRTAHRRLCYVTLQTTIALHPDQANIIGQMMKKLFLDENGNGKSDDSSWMANIP